MVAEPYELVTPGDLGDELAAFTRAMHALNVSTNTINESVYAGQLSIRPSRDLVAVTKLVEIPHIVVASAAHSQRSRARERDPRAAGAAGCVELSTARPCSCVRTSWAACQRSSGSLARQTRTRRSRSFPKFL